MTAARFPRLVFAVLLSAVGCDSLPSLGGCGGGGGKADGGKTDAGDAGDAGVTVVDVGGGGAGGPAAPSSNPVRYVALMTDTNTACAAVGKWTGRHLFTTTSGAQAAWKETAKLPGALRRFCVYTWGAGGPPGPQPVIPGAARVDPDPDIVVPQGPTPRTLLAAHELATLTGLGAQAATTPPSHWPYAVSQEGMPYVAVVDTADSRGPGPTTLPVFDGARSHLKHGLMMARLIEAVRCPRRLPQCTKRQFFAQAFPYTDQDATEVSPGGVRGSLGSLAAALGESVARWRAQPDRVSSPLIINMSLGWDFANHPEVSPDDPTTMPSHTELLDLVSPDTSVPTTIQAVHHALTLAACEGALSFAASGNARGAPCEQTGIMGPAAWENLPAPSSDECQKLGVNVGSKRPSTLVFGVGGLDSEHRPIANTRHGSMPRFALYAHQAAIEVDSGTGPSPKYSEPWTGTSVATAGMSAIAAQVWSFQGPGQPASSILATIDSAGVSTSVDARWLRPTSVAQSSIKRIEAHAVMNKVDSNNNPYAAPQTGTNPIFTAILDQGPVLVAPPPTSPVLVPLTPITSTATCDGEPLPILAAPGYSPAPGGSYPTDIIRPQPPMPLCPNCPIVKKPPPKKEDDGSGTAPIATLVVPEYELELELGPDYATTNPAGVVDQPVLELDDGSGTLLIVALGSITVTSTRANIDLSAYTITTGQTQQTLSAWLDGHPSITSARLRLTADDDGSGSRFAPQTVTEVISVVRQ